MTHTKPIRVLPQIFSMDQTQTGIYFSALECRPVFSLHPWNLIKSISTIRGNEDEQGVHGLRESRQRALSKYPGDPSWTQLQCLISSLPLPFQACKPATLHLTSRWPLPLKSGRMQVLSSHGNDASQHWASFRWVAHPVEKETDWWSENQRNWLALPLTAHVT